MSLDALWDGVVDLSPAGACQAVFALLGAGIVSLTLLPAATQKHLLDYGARDPAANTGKRETTGTTTKTIEMTETTTEPTNTTTEPTKSAGRLERFVAATVTRLQVPHGWFASFYVFYLAAAAAWAVQWWLWPGWDKANALAWLVRRQAAAGSSSMSLAQVCIVVGLECVQAARRLYEHRSVLKPSRSKMNAAHFLLGLAYYGIMSIAVWIEGAHAILAAHESGVAVPWLAPGTRTKLAMGVPVFVAASVGQYRCHAHLASLVKYSLPRQGLFRRLVCPHYTCELVLYLGLAVAAAPAGRLLNRTLLWSEVFVLISLGVTAARTKAWYAGTFGAAAVAGKWAMVPFVF